MRLWTPLTLVCGIPEFDKNKVDDSVVFEYFSPPTERSRHHDSPPLSEHFTQATRVSRQQVNTDDGSPREEVGRIMYNYNATISTSAWWGAGSTREDEEHRKHDDFFTGLKAETSPLREDGKRARMTMESLLALRSLRGGEDSDDLANFLVSPAGPRNETKRGTKNSGRKGENKDNRRVGEVAPKMIEEEEEEEDDFFFNSDGEHNETLPLIYDVRDMRRKELELDFDDEEEDSYSGAMNETAPVRRSDDDDGVKVDGRRLGFEEDLEMAEKEFDKGSREKRVSTNRCIYRFKGFNLGAGDGPYIPSLLKSGNQMAYTHLRDSTWLYFQDRMWKIGYLSEKWPEKNDDEQIAQIQEEKTKEEKKKEEEKKKKEEEKKKKEEDDKKKAEEEAKKKENEEEKQEQKQGEEKNKVDTEEDEDVVEVATLLDENGVPIPPKNPDDMIAELRYKKALELYHDLQAIDLSEELKAQELAGSYNLATKRNSHGVRAYQLEGTMQLLYGTFEWMENVSPFSWIPRWRKVTIEIRECNLISDVREETCAALHRDNFVGQVSSCGTCLPGFSGDDPPSDNACTSQGTAGFDNEGKSRTCLALAPSGFEHQEWINERRFYLQDYKLPSGTFYKAQAFRNELNESWEPILYHCAAQDAWNIASLATDQVYTSGGSGLEDFTILKNWDDNCYQKVSGFDNCARYKKSLNPESSLYELDMRYPGTDDVTVSEEPTIPHCAVKCKRDELCRGFQWILLPKLGLNGCCITYEYYPMSPPLIFVDKQTRIEEEERHDQWAHCKVEGAIDPTYTKIAVIRNGDFEISPFGESDLSDDDGGGETISLSAISLRHRAVKHWQASGQTLLGWNQASLYDSGLGDMHVRLTMTDDFIEQEIFMPPEYGHVISFSAAREERAGLLYLKVSINNIVMKSFLPDGGGFRPYNVLVKAAQPIGSRPRDDDDSLYLMEIDVMNQTDMWNNGTWNDTWIDAFEYNATANYTGEMTEEELIYEEGMSLLRQGIARIRFTHATPQPGTIFIDYVTISNADGSIGGPYEDLARGACPSCARSDVSHPSYPKNWYEANVTMKWTEDPRRLSDYRKPAFVEVDLAMECDAGDEIRTVVSESCTAERFFTKHCEEFFLWSIGLGSAVLFVIGMFLWYWRRSSLLSEAWVRLQLRIGVMKMNDPCCPTSMRGRTIEEYITVKHFNNRFPHHGMTFWEIEDLNTANKKGRQMRKPGAWQRMKDKLKRPTKARMDVTNEFPERSDRNPREKYESKVDIFNEHTRDRVERQTIKSYRKGQHDRQRATPFDFTLDKYAWCCPFEIDLEDNQVTRGIGPSPVIYPFRLDVPGFFTDKKKNKVALTLKVNRNIFKFEQYVEQLERGDTKEYTKGYKNDALIAKVSRKRAKLSRFAAFTRSESRRDHPMLLSDVNESRCRIRFGKNEARWCLREEIYEEVFDLETTRRTLGKISVQYSNSFRGLKPMKCTIKGIERQSDVIAAFCFVFGIIYQRRYRPRSFPPIHGEAVKGVVREKDDDDEDEDEEKDDGASEDQDANQEPYQDANQQPYLDANRQQYQDANRQPYLDANRQPYLDANRQPYQDANQQSEKQEGVEPSEQQREGQDRAASASNSDMVTPAGGERPASSSSGMVHPHDETQRPATSSSSGQPAEKDKPPTSSGSNQSGGEEERPGASSSSYKRPGHRLRSRSRSNSRVEVAPMPVQAEDTMQVQDA